MNPAEKYILDQVEPFKSILLQIQILIEGTIPELELKYKWRLPYYYLNGHPFCFLNVTKGYVDIGIRVGTHLKEHYPYMVSENRKVMKSLRYHSIEEIDSKILVEILLLLKEDLKEFYSK